MPVQDLGSPPPNLVVYGLQGTGKLHTVSSVLSAREFPHATVKSQECHSLRHLLSKIHTACIGAVYEEGDGAADEAYERRTDSVNSLNVNLQRLLQGRDRKLVLVLDGIDKQRGLNPNTLPALARLSDIVCFKQSSCNDMLTCVLDTKPLPCPNRDHTTGSLPTESRHSASSFPTLQSS
jgi:hypothetical protein